jgi:rhomboid family GlyGly-CTERM serine protease
VKFWRKPGWAWCAVAAALALGSALAQGRSPAAIDWQPGLAASQPWRAFSAAFVHYSALHLAGNAAGLALAAALGVAARTPWRQALAWLAAWPLTQLGLLLQPDLAHYGGLSGVVHAGVAIVCVHLLFAGHRWLGGAMLAGVLLKVMSETPWGAPLRHPPDWDIAIAPLVHATGLVSGTSCALLAEGAAWRRRGRLIGSE